MSARLSALPSLSTGVVRRTEPLAPLDAAPLLVPAIFALGVVWACAVSFAVLSPVPIVIQALPIGLAWCFCFMVMPPLLWGSLRNFATTALLIHGAIALVSALISDPERMIMAGRYVLLFAVMAIVVAVRMQGPAHLRALRIGLACGALVYLVYNALFMDVAAVATSGHRAGESHPNHVGAIASTAAVVFFAELLLARRRLAAINLVHLVCFTACVGMLLLTKSRTALLTLAAGLAVLWWLQGFGARMRILMAALAVAVAAVAVIGTEFFSETYDSLTDPRRDISTAAGRLHLWEYAWGLFQEEPLLGHGPGADEEIFERQFNNTFCHNGTLSNLVNVGLLGTIPLVYVLVCCFRRMPSLARQPARHWAIAAVIAACVMSLAENLFFSIGTPAGLLFLCAIADIASANPAAQPAAATLDRARRS